VSAARGTNWTLTTPSGAGAVAVVQLTGDVDAAIAACGSTRVQVGEVKVRDLLGVDRGMVARYSESMCQLMPHGGVAVVRELCRALCERGIAEARELDSALMYPEARSEVEARALAALSRAASPLAVDLLLAQHELWRETGLSATTPPSSRGAGVPADMYRDRLLKRLINPPLVVAMGPSNIGKSTLVNALAGRSVSIVADEPGTTRDHVGVLLDLDGLVVRYVDTPGLRDGAGEIEREAVRLTQEVVSSADLVLLCGDAGSGLNSVPFRCDFMVVALREDLARAQFARHNPHARVSVQRGEGLRELIDAIKEKLVPARLMTGEMARVAWRFW
jgi:tRNA U34 5-carboxymethylaminomethyl modifying GTPase MnmE/TrmE